MNAGAAKQAPPDTASGGGAAALRLRALLATQGARQGGLLVFLLLATLAFPKDIPLGVYGLGITNGTALALQAVAIVLVYRSNRIINFSQAAIGAFGAFVFQASATYRPLLRWFGFLCGDECGSTAVAVNYWLSFLVGLLLPVLLAGVVYGLVIKRFAHAPRLLLTVATIFVAPALFSANGYILDLFSTDQQEAELRLGGEGRAEFPVDASFAFGGAVFRFTDVLTIVVAIAAVVGLFVYLRRSRVGVAIRATSESPDRAATLGIDVGRVTVRIWLISGGLSAIASLLAASGSNTASVGGDLPTLLVILTAAAIASLVSLPMTLVACMVLGAVQQATLWAFGSPTPFLGSLVLVLTATFALQRAQASRGELELASTFSTAREVRAVPRELSRLPAVRAWRRALLVLGAVTFLGMPFLLSPAQVDALTTCLIMAVIALSLLVLTGWAGQISLGQIGFAGIGAFAAACSRLPFLLALLVGIAAGAAVAVLVGFPALRLRGLHLAIISLGLSVSISLLLLNPEYGGKALPADLARPQLLGVDLEDARVFYYLVLFGVLLAVLAVVGLRRSRTARALLASRDNELAAQSLGISLLRARLTAFAISGGLAAYGGVLLAYQQHAVQSGTFRVDAGVVLFQSAVLGGLGHISGPLLGVAALFGPGLFELPVLLALFLVGPGALVIVLTVPGGIAQALFDVRDNFLRRLAKREGIRVPALLGPTDDDAEDVAPLLPRNDGPGASTYVPARYRLPSQWALNVPEGDSRVAARVPSSEALVD